jgi:hypothetical protein
MDTPKLTALHLEALILPHALALWLYCSCREAASLASSTRLLSFVFRVCCDRIVLFFSFSFTSACVANSFSEQPDQSNRRISRVLLLRCTVFRLDTLLIPLPSIAELNLFERLHSILPEVATFVETPTCLRKTIAKPI